MNDSQITTVTEAYLFLDDHPIFNLGIGCRENSIEWEMAIVNPLTEERDDDPSKNTAVRFWLEANVWEIPSEGEADDPKEYYLGRPRHDIDLDCGAATFEEALIKLAQLVKAKYGDYEEEKEIQAA